MMHLEQMDLVSLQRQVIISRAEKQENFALFIYSIAGAQTAQKMEEKKEGRIIIHT